MSRDYVLEPFRAAVDFQIDYARELNEQQHAAVTAPPGPALVLAGAGAGKTRTLIYRVAYLLEQGIPADRILLLTFTNKAAREMMRRVTDLLGNDLGELWGGTFHSVGHRILRRHAQLVGYEKSFTILDREDATDLIKACLGDSQIDPQVTRFPKADVLSDIFSMALNTARSVPKIVEEEYDYFQTVTAQIAALAEKYQARKRAANVMDFDDLLALWLKLLQEQAEIRESYQRKFQFILVDEYQDTNTLQGEIIDLLGARHRNVMVVGDDSQSIYSWRGANFQNILKFPERYKDAQIYKIETNYRSTPEILEVANAAIRPNVNQFSKQLAAWRTSGMKPGLVPCADANVQARFVAQRLLQLREEGTPLNNMAVLYRSHFHTLELQLELTRRNIPFSITSGIRFFEQAHLKDATAYLKLVCNSHDEMAFKRLVQILPGVGPKAAGKLWNEFLGRWTSLSSSGGEGQGEEARKSSKTPLAAALQGCAPLVPKRAAALWAELAITFSQIEVEPIRHQPSEMLRVILEAGYEDYLKANFTNYRSRLDDLTQLANFAVGFKSTEEFLTQLSLLTNVEAEDNQPANADKEQVRLSTIHQAKGLEFDVVFAIMLCEGLFPSSQSQKNEASIEEERRLFYVAITRARNELYLSFPLIRTGLGGDIAPQRSRFLREIPADLLEEWNLRQANPFG